MIKWIKNLFKKDYILIDYSSNSYGHVSILVFKNSKKEYHFTTNVAKDRNLDKIYNKVNELKKEHNIIMVKKKNHNKSLW